MKMNIFLCALFLSIIPLAAMQNEIEPIKQYDCENAGKKEELAKYITELCTGILNNDIHKVKAVLFPDLPLEQKTKSEIVIKTGCELANAVATNEGQPMLSYAINQHGNPEIIKCLLQAGARADACYNQKIMEKGTTRLLPADAAHQNLTPLHVAVSEYQCCLKGNNNNGKKLANSEEIINLLLAFEASPLAKNGAGISPYSLSYDNSWLKNLFDQYLEQNKKSVEAFATALYLRCGKNSPACNPLPSVLKNIAGYVPLPLHLIATMECYGNMEPNAMLELQNMLYNAVMYNKAKQVEWILFPERFVKGMKPANKNVLSKLANCAVNSGYQRKCSILLMIIQDRLRSIDPEIIALLLQAGANVNDLCAGHTALYSAVEQYLKLNKTLPDHMSRNIFKIIELLLVFGADPLVVNGAGETAYSMCSNCKELKDLFDQVLKKKIDVSVLKAVQTPDVVDQNLRLLKEKLCNSVMHFPYDIDLIKLILKKSADEDNSMLSKLLHCPVNYCGESILFFALDSTAGAIEPLLQAGADPNACSWRLMRPLHLVVNEYLKLTKKNIPKNDWCEIIRNGRYEIIKLLLNYGADPLVVNGAGETAYSMGSNCKELKDLFDQVLEKKIGASALKALQPPDVVAQNVSKNHQDVVTNRVVQNVAVPINRALSVQTPSWFSRIGAPTHWWARAGLAALSGLGTYKALRAIQVPHSGKLSLCLSAGIFLAKPMRKGITWAIDRFRSKKH